MDHYRLSDELRNQLLENAAWGKAGVTPRLDESEVIEERKSCGSKKKAKKMDGYMEDTEYEDEEEYEELEEAHVCPLCVSQLDEAIDEERILEHLNVVVGLVDRLTQLQEGEEGDIADIIDETLAELLFDDEFDDEDALEERNDQSKARKNQVEDEEGFTRAERPAKGEPGEHSTGGSKRYKKKVRGAK